MFDRFARPAEVQLDPASIRPVFERPRLKLRAIDRRGGVGKRGSTTDDVLVGLQRDEYV